MLFLFLFSIHFSPASHASFRSSAAKITEVDTIYVCTSPIAPPMPGMSIAIQYPISNINGGRHATRTNRERSAMHAAAIDAWMPTLKRLTECWMNTRCDRYLGQIAMRQNT